MFFYKVPPRAATCNPEKIWNCYFHHYRTSEGGGQNSLCASYLPISICKRDLIDTCHEDSRAQYIDLETKHQLLREMYCNSSSYEGLADVTRCLTASDTEPSRLAANFTSEYDAVTRERLFICRKLLDRVNRFDEAMKTCSTATPDGKELWRKAASSYLLMFGCSSVDDNGEESTQEPLPTTNSEST